MRTRTQLLAQAFKGTVVEDMGYRGVIQTTGDTPGFLRYHSATGVHKVLRTGRKWQSSGVVLAAEEIDSFLESMGIKSIEPTSNQLDALAELSKSPIHQHFTAGGGILQTPSAYIRVSPISGVDVVYKVLTKWRVARHLCSKETLQALLTNTRFREIAAHDIIAAILQLRKEVTDHDPERSDRTGTAGSSGTDEEAEGAAEDVRRQAEGSHQDES